MFPSCKNCALGPNKCPGVCLYEGRDYCSCYEPKMLLERVSDKDVARWFRDKTGCGLHDAKVAIDKLVFALKHHPTQMTDNPYELKVLWRFKDNYYPEDKDYE